MPTAKRLAFDTALALAAGFTAYLLSCLIAMPGPLPATGFGHEWALMSVQPFAFVGQYPQRLLSPLLGHLIGLDGPDYFWFSRLLSVLLLTTVFAFCRSRGCDRAAAGLVTLAVAISGAIQIYKGLVGFSDNLSFALLLLAAMLARHGALFWLVLLVNLTNHELVVFFVPWLWFLRWQQGGSWRFDGPALAVVLGLYFGYSRYVSAHAAHQSFTAGFFLDNHFLPWGTMWLLLFAVVHWISMFGPLLAVLAWHQLSPRPQHERWQLWLVLGGIAGIFGFAYDVLRHANILVVPLVIASARVLQDRRARLPFAVLIAASALSCWWLGQPVGPGGGQALKSITDLLLPCNVLQVEPPGHLRIDNANMIGCVLPQIWGRLLLYGAALALFVGAGWWLRRRFPPTPGARQPGPATAP